jgi:hypothetical protein
MKKIKASGIINNKYQSKMKNLLNQELQTICKKCHSVRKELNFNELPEQMKKEIGKVNDRSIKFFNCEKCGEISISFQSVSF